MQAKCRPWRAICIVCVNFKFLLNLSKWHYESEEDLLLMSYFDYLTPPNGYILKKPRAPRLRRKPTDARVIYDVQKPSDLVTTKFYIHSWFVPSIVGEKKHKILKSQKMMMKMKRGRGRRWEFCRAECFGISVPCYLNYDSFKAARERKFKHAIGFCRNYSSRGYTVTSAQDWYHRKHST